MKWNECEKRKIVTLLKWGLLYFGGGVLRTTWRGRGQLPSGQRGYVPEPLNI